jgi:hypothetical protein
LSDATRFSPAWTRGDAATFARVLGTGTSAKPVNHEDPVHQERINRYDRNISYFAQNQYWSLNAKALAENDFLALRVNYTGIATRSIEMKADWLFEEPIGINVIPINSDTTGDQVEKADSDKEKGVRLKVKDRINEIRKHNNSAQWDWVEAIMGLTCGDFFIRVNATAEDTHPTIDILDPSYVFPDYPDDITKPMLACQIQYEVDREGEATEDEENIFNVRITEDYRLELVGDDSPDILDELEVLTDEDLEDLMTEQQETGKPSLRLSCIYRLFHNEDLVEGSKRDIGIPAIPIVHGVNAVTVANRRYGVDEIDRLVPKIEKYNETFFYAERIGRMNAHAKLFVSGIRPETAKPIQADFDDVIYGGPDTAAQVISLPSDTAILSFVTEALEREMHRDAHIPVIAQGEAEVGYGAPSGLALLIRFGPLQSVTRRHRLTYGAAKDATYHLCLMFDEMVIDGDEYGTKWKYDTWEFKYDWYDAMPKAMNEIISDMGAASDARVPLLSKRSARERIPGVDPDQEERRIKEEMAATGQDSLDAPADTTQNGGGNGNNSFSDDFAALFTSPAQTPAQASPVGGGPGANQGR